MAKRKQGGGFAAKKHQEAEAMRKRTEQRSLLIGGGIIVAIVIALIALGPLLSDDSEPEPAAEVVAADVVVADPSTESRPLQDVSPTDRADFYATYPDMVIDTDKEYEAIIHTDKGIMRLELFDDDAPLTVNNFVFLAREGFYDGLTFHRVMEDFMAQGGDPTGTGGGGPGYRFADEVDNGLAFDRSGLLAMANAGPGTNGSQFFITFVETPRLNGAHTIFGEVIEGITVLDDITREPPPRGGDVIEQIDIVEK